MIDKAENGRIIVCTPHMAELAHLLHVSLAELQQNRFSLLDRFCRQTGCMMVSKDAATIVYYSLNDKTCRYYINQTGNSGMATAGSGDVLSGLLGALLAGLFAQNDINRAVFGKTMSAGVYYHGLAGNYAAEELGEISMTAGDLIRHFPNAFKQK
jgi:NAD(P)H-hydrate epimerase